MASNLNHLYLKRLTGLVWGLMVRIRAIFPIKGVLYADGGGCCGDCGR